jgi:gamma-glutamyl hercynylcysteine S-oxide synthase
MSSSAIASRSAFSGLAESRARTDELFRLVRPEVLYDRPIPERHRIVFYIGHLEAFDRNLIARDTFGLAPFQEQLDRLFAFGIDPTGGALPGDKPSDWPALDEVRAYVERTRAAVDECARRVAGPRAAHPNLENDLVFHVAVEHRLMHAETLAYMFHQLPLDGKVGRKSTSEAPLLLSGARPVPRRIEIPAGEATLGVPRSESRLGAAPFGWDNEFEVHSQSVPAFAIDAHKVTNAQFLEFIRQGGYDNASLWTPEAWEWINANNIRHPGFWLARGNEWYYKTMFEEVSLPFDWPVYVSHAEASAYARWRCAALPTESQFHRAACGTPEGRERAFPWGNEIGSDARSRGNFDFARWDPTPVGAHPEGSSAFGVDELAGNGWEWTSTIFGPFDGFRPFSFYPGYSADFFEGKHYVMKGASPRTAACFLRRSFRNWFQPHYPYVYAAFRCVEN